MTMIGGAAAAVGGAIGFALVLCGALYHKHRISRISAAMPQASSLEVKA